MNDQELLQSILDAMTQHNSYLQRLSTQSVNEILRKFDKLSITALNSLRDALEELSEAELKALAGASYTTPQLLEVREIVKSWGQSIASELPVILVESSAALAAYESAYIYWLANKKAPAVNGTTLLNKAKKKPYAGGQLMNHIFPSVAENLRQKVERVIRSGIDAGQTNQEIIKQIKGTKKLNYQDGILNQTRTVIDAEVRTARAHVSSDAYLETWKALGYEYTRDVATLDGRTTMLCASRDGRVQKLGEGYQRVPYHYRCRTVQVGCDADGEMPGLRPYVADHRAVKNIPKDEREGKIGQVNANETYAKWFSRQDEAFQKEWLGSTRYQLYKDGKYSIDKFIDPQGKLYTLDDLRKLDQKSFESVFQNSKSGKSFKQPTNEISIYDLPSRVHKPDISTPARKKAVAFEEEFRESRSEYGIFISNDGEKLYPLSGDINKVNVPSELWGKVVGTTFTHNHPGGSNFSIDDIITAAELNLAEVRAVTQHMRFIMSKGELNKLWPSESEIRQALKELNPKALDLTRNMINSDRINSRYAQSELEHQLWMLVAHKLGLKYKREKS